MAYEGTEGSELWLWRVASGVRGQSKNQVSCDAVIILDTSYGFHPSIVVFMGLIEGTGDHFCLFKPARHSIYPSISACLIPIYFGAFTCFYGWIGRLLKALVKWFCSNMIVILLVFSAWRWSWSILIWNTAIIKRPWLQLKKPNRFTMERSVRLLWTGEGIWRDCQHYEYYIYMWWYSHWYSPWYSHYWWSISRSYPMNTLMVN